MFSSAICNLVAVLGGWERHSGAWLVRVLSQGPVEYQSLRGGEWRNDGATEGGCSCVGECSQLTFPCQIASTWSQTGSGRIVAARPQHFGRTLCRYDLVPVPPEPSLFAEGSGIPPSWGITTNGEQASPPGTAPGVVNIWRGTRELLEGIPQSMLNRE